MKTFTFNLNEDQLNVIAAGLGELPLKHSNSVLQELTKQFQAQQKVPTEPVTE
jgi:hypothetical protein